MSKFKIAIAGGALIIFGAGCAVAPAQKEEKTPTSQDNESNEVIVEMTSSGFKPSVFSIKTGTTVKFINKDSVPRWPASGLHPTHQICPGFDSMKGIAPGESYSVTFTDIKTCPMHDHLNPGTRGSITVEK